jgi:hypothetical protein
MAIFLRQVMNFFLAIAKNPLERAPRSLLAYTLFACKTFFDFYVNKTYLCKQQLRARTFLLGNRGVLAFLIHASFIGG